jgi:hypothetical protein
MGDGIKRLLSLSLNVIRSANGALAVDEIDTGLHHTVMVKMWRLVVETACRLDVQVFATSHSLDCLRALAWLCEEDLSIAQHVSAHRVERNSPATTRYSAEELAIAARQRMEIR